MNATRPPRGSVLLVEDEVMIRMMVADMLEELGYTVAGEAGEINEAIRLAQTIYYDLAILDVNVNGKVISPVADLIKARNRPFIFATGYGSSGLPEEYRDLPGRYAWQGHRQCVAQRTVVSCGCSITFNCRAGSFAGGKRRASEPGGADGARRANRLKARRQRAPARRRLISAYR